MKVQCSNKFSVGAALAVGVALGTAFENLAAGIAIGAALGIGGEACSTWWKKRRIEKKENS